MIIYILLVILILILPKILKSLRIEKQKKIYIIIISIVLIFIMGFRNISLGQNDIEVSYYPMYQSINGLNFKAIFDLYNYDFFFLVLMKLTTLVSDKFQVFLFISSAIFISSISLFIYRESEKPALSFILFLALGIFGFNITILRHSLALSFVIFAYIFLKNKRYIFFSIFVILAMLTHLSSLVIIGLLALLVFKKHRLTHLYLLLIGVFIFSYFWGENFLNMLFDIMNINRFDRYANHVETFNLTLYFLNLFLFIVSTILFVFNKKNMTYQRQCSIRKQFAICTISLVFLNFSVFFALFFRISMFFGIYTVILLPNVLSEVKNRLYNNLITATVVVLYVIYFLMFSLENTRIVPYQLFF